jgi:hypothetical protein
MDEVYRIYKIENLYSGLEEKVHGKVYALESIEQEFEFEEQAEDWINQKGNRMTEYTILRVLTK